MIANRMGDIDNVGVNAAHLDDAAPAGIPQGGIGASTGPGGDMTREANGGRFTPREGPVTPREGTDSRPGPQGEANFLDRLEVESREPVPEEEASILGTFREEQLERAAFMDSMDEPWPSGLREDTGQTNETSQTNQTTASGSTHASGASSTSWKSNMSNRVKHARNKIGKLVKGDRKAVDDDSRIIRKYSFKTAGTVREIVLAHGQAVWTLKLDGETIGTKAHRNNAWSAYNCSVEFEIPLPDGNSEPIAGTVRMEWVPRKAKWEYSLLVGGTFLQPSWSKGRGVVPDEPPEVYDHAAQQEEAGAGGDALVAPQEEETGEDTRQDAEADEDASVEEATI